MLKKYYTQQFKNISDDIYSTKQVEQYQAAAQELRQEILQNKIASLSIVLNEGNDLVQLQEWVKKINFYERVFVLGTGGSSLGGKTITALQAQHKVTFLESIDPTTIANALQNIDLKKCFFLVVSKSGETIETICQTLIILDLFAQKEVTNLSNNFLFITESQTNSIAKIAQKISAEILPHNPKIGGRYSCFSLVGLLPTLIADLDAAKFLMGAKTMLEKFLKDECDKIQHSCLVQLSLYEQGFVNNVVMPYVDVLKNFTDWYRQLYAESLGKNNFGATPINSMGTIDQHSQLQLYLDGFHNKFFTFVTAKNIENVFANDYSIKDLQGCSTLFGGKKLTEILKIEQDSTIETINQKKLPIRIFALEKLDEEMLGALMMQMVLEVILIAKIKKIDPFDQPAVELRKVLAKEWLRGITN